MEILLKNKHGLFYKFSKNKEQTPPKNAISPVINNPQDAQTFLKSVQPQSPGKWLDVWKEVNPITGYTVIPEDQILQKLADMLVSKKLFVLSQQKNTVTNTANNGHKGSTSGDSTASLGGTKIDKPATNTSPGEGKNSPSDNNAKETASPGKPSNKDDETKGCPISMISGEEVLPLEDYTLPGPMPFVWKRFYRTGHSIDNGIGHGWTHSASEQLYLDKQDVILSDDEGRQLNFARPDLYQRSKLINEGLNLDFVGKDCFILKQDGQGDKVFTRLGDGNRFRLSKICHIAYQEPQRDLYGNQSQERGYCINLHYDAHNQLTRLEGNWGKSLKLNRNSQGRIENLQLVNEQKALAKVIAEYDYDTHGDLIAHRNAAGEGEIYQYNNHIISQRTLIGGFSYYYEWDRQDNQARCLRNWGDDGIYDYHFKWDPENNASFATDSRGFTTAYIYNEFGRIVQETDPEGGIHLYTYDRGRKVSYTDPEGHTTQYSFNKENQSSGNQNALGQHQTISYFRGKPTEFKDKDGTIWKREYTRHGLLKTLIDPYGRETRFSYHDSGLLSQQTDPEGRSTKYAWNSQGELAQVTDFDGNQQQLKYDALGQVRERHVLIKGQSEPSITQYSYTRTGQLEKIIAPNGDTTSYKYNKNDQLVQHSDPQGRITQFEYDGLSQVIKRTDANGYTLHYQYDKERNLTALINENGDSYRFEYDGCERLIKETGFDGRVQHYKYNKAGYLIKHLDSGTVSSEYERDALGQMLTKTSKHISNNLPLERSRYRYDDAGRLVETYNQHQYITFDYDRLGNLEKEHHSDINDKQQRVSASKVDIRYGNLLPGIRSHITLPDGQRIDYLYSKDKKQLLEKIQFNNQTITQIQRDAIGREIERSQGMVSTQTEYDPMGRLQKQQAVNQGNKQNIIQREFSYDKFGNLNRFKDGQHETRYVYDLLNRIEKTEGEFEENFSFDPAGNILGINETSQQSTQSDNASGNRLKMQGDRKFSYDERGNLIKELRGKGGKLSTLFEYNLQNQLVKVIKDGQTIDYKYDPLGRRIEKQDTFGTTRYLWADDQLTQEIRNNIKKTYVYEPQSFKPVALIQDGEVYHYHLDHLGTPRELINQQGEIVWKVRYKTYGNVAVKEHEEIENNLRFQGQYFDEETGLHYNRHRYYNPSTGQFISQDPIGLLGGVNNYQYAPNPLGWIDPFGLCKESIDSKKSGYSVIGEGGRIVEELSAETVLVRFEPPNVDTPMSPHESPYFDVSKGMEYGLKPDHHKALFVVSKDNLETLSALRKKQGYFDEGVVLRESTLGELMSENPGANLLSDFRLNGNTLGIEKGGYILTTGDRNINKENI